MKAAESTIAHDESHVSGANFLQDHGQEFSRSLCSVGRYTTLPNTGNESVDVHEIFRTVIVPERRPTQEDGTGLIERCRIPFFEYFTTA